MTPEEAAAAAAAQQASAQWLEQNRPDMVQQQNTAEQAAAQNKAYLENKTTVLPYYSLWGAPQYADYSKLNQAEREKYYQQEGSNLSMVYNERGQREYLTPNEFKQRYGVSDAQFESIKYDIFNNTFAVNPESVPSQLRATYNEQLRERVSEYYMANPSQRFQEIEARYAWQKGNVITPGGTYRQGEMEQYDPSGFVGFSGRAAVYANNWLRSEYGIGAPDNEQVYRERQAEKAAAAIGQPFTYTEYELQAMREAQSRPGFTPTEQLGDINTQRALKGLEMMRSMGFNVASADVLAGRTLEYQRKAAWYTPGTKDDQFFGGELQKWAESKVETASAYHRIGMKSGVPIPANVFEYQADLAVEFLKGEPHKASERFSPVSGEMAKQLPGGEGLQEYQWRQGIATDKMPGTKIEPTSYWSGVEAIIAAEGKYGPYSVLAGARKEGDYIARAPSSNLPDTIPVQYKAPFKSVSSPADISQEKKPQGVFERVGTDIWNVTKAIPSVRTGFEAQAVGGDVTVSKGDTGGLPAPFLSKSEAPQYAANGPIDLVIEKATKGQLPSVGDLWESTPIARIAANWSWDSSKTDINQVVPVQRGTTGLLNTIAVVPFANEVTVGGKALQESTLLKDLVFTKNIRTGYLSEASSAAIETLERSNAREVRGVLGKIYQPTYEAVAYAKELYTGKDFGLIGRVARGTALFKSPTGIVDTAVYGKNALDLSMGIGKYGTNVEGNVLYRGLQGSGAAKIRGLEIGDTYIPGGIRSFGGNLDTGVYYSRGTNVVLEYAPKKETLALIDPVQHELILKTGAYKVAGIRNVDVIVPFIKEPTTATIYTIEDAAMPISRTISKWGIGAGLAIGGVVFGREAVAAPDTTRVSQGIPRTPVSGAPGVFFTGEIKPAFGSGRLPEDVTNEYQPSGFLGLGGLLPEQPSEEKTRAYALDFASRMQSNPVITGLQMQYDIVKAPMSTVGGVASRLTMGASEFLYKPEPIVEGGYSEKESTTVFALHTFRSTETVALPNQTAISGGNQTISNLGMWLDANKNSIDRTNPSAVKTYNERVNLFNEMQKQNPVVVTTFGGTKDIITETGGTKTVTTITGESSQKVYASEWDKFVEGSGRFTRWITGLPLNKQEAYFTTIKSEPGLMGEAKRGLFYFGTTIVNKPAELAPAALQGATLAGAAKMAPGFLAGLSESSGLTAKAATFLQTPGGANIAKAGLLAGFGGMYTYDVTEKFTATPEKTKENVYRSTPALVAMYGGGGGFDWVGDVRVVRGMSSPSGATFSGVRVQNAYFGGGRIPTGQRYAGAFSPVESYVFTRGAPRPVTQRPIARPMLPEPSGVSPEAAARASSITESADVYQNMDLSGEARPFEVKTAREVQPDASLKFRDMSGKGKPFSMPDQKPAGIKTQPKAEVVFEGDTSGRSSPFSVKTQAEVKAGYWDTPERLGGDISGRARDFSVKTENEFLSDLPRDTSGKADMFSIRTQNEIMQGWEQEKALKEQQFYNVGYASNVALNRVESGFMDTIIETDSGLKPATSPFVAEWKRWKPEQQVATEQYNPLAPKRVYAEPQPEPITKSYTFDSWLNPRTPITLSESEVALKFQQMEKMGANEISIPGRKDKGIADFETLTKAAKNIGYRITKPMFEQGLDSESGVWVATFEKSPRKRTYAEPQPELNIPTSKESALQKELSAMNPAFRDNAISLGVEKELQNMHPAYRDEFNLRGGNKQKPRYMTFIEREGSYTQVELEAKFREIESASIFGVGTGTGSQKGIGTRVNPFTDIEPENRSMTGIDEYKRNKFITTVSPPKPTDLTNKYRKSGEDIIPFKNIDVRVVPFKFSKVTETSKPWERTKVQEQPWERVTETPRPHKFIDPIPPTPKPPITGVPFGGLPGGGGSNRPFGNLYASMWHRNNLVADQPYLSRGMRGIDLGAGLFNDYKESKPRRKSRRKKK